jgi:hypothetical protein
MRTALRVVRNLVILALLVAGAALGCRALQPPTWGEIAAEHLDEAVDELGGDVAHRLRGSTVAPSTTARVREAVVTQARENGFAVGLLASGDDGDANWAELTLLSHYQHEGAFGSRPRLDVGGCVRIAVTHGAADWDEGTDPRVSSRSVECPADAPPPAEPFEVRRNPSDARFRVDGVRPRDHDIEAWWPPCFGTSGYCPGG